MSWAESKWIVDNILRKIGQQPNNMRSFVATPLSNTSIGLTFLEPEDSYVEGNLICSVGGVMIRKSTTEYPKTPSDGELVIVNKELGKYATTPFVIENLDEDTTYYFSAFPFSAQGAYNLSSSAVNRAKMTPANGEAVTVNINIDDDSAFSTVRVRCVDETDSTKTKVATLSPTKKTATFTAMTGHKYHVEFGEMKDYSQPTRTVSKVAVAGGASQYTGNYEYFTSEIVTTYPRGSTVTCIKDNIKYTATSTSGSYTFKVHEVGTWTVTSTDGNQTSTRTVNITRTKERKTVTLAYFESTIRVTYPVGATLTCSYGGTTYTAPNTSGTYTFTVQSAGTWTIKAVKGRETSMDTVSITASGQSRSVALSFIKIYGIKRDFTSSSPVWTRTDDAVGKTAKVSVGTVAGHSDFDNCYPWSEMKRKTFSTGDVMVKIPVFYYQRTRSGNIESMRIADKPIDGFKKHPGSGCYVSAYCVNEDITSTTNGKIYVGDGGEQQLKEKLANKGKNWRMMGYEEVSALVFLTLIEFATNNMRNVFVLDNKASSSTEIGDADGVPNLTGVTAERNRTIYRGVDDWMGYSRMFSIKIGVSESYWSTNLSFDNESFNVKKRKDGTYSSEPMKYVRNITYVKNKEWILLPTELGASHDTHYASYFGETYMIKTKDENRYEYMSFGGQYRGLFGFRESSLSCIRTTYREEN